VKILAIGNMYPPLHEGGYEVVWEAAVEHLRSEGHEVTVLTTDHRRREAPSSESGVFRDLRWYWRAHGWPRMHPLARLRLERVNARVLDRHLRAERPDVVSWWAMGGMSLSLIERVWRMGLPSAAAVCDDWMVYGPEVDGWTRMFATRPRAAVITERLAGIPTRPDLAHAGPVLFPSETTRDTALARWPLESVVVCHQGVSSKLFPPRPESPWRWRLLYVGRIDERKGVDLAVEALVRLPDEATLLIAGVGDEAYGTQLRELASRLGVSSRVTFTARPRDQLRGLYEAADVVVFPVRWEEPWGLVPLEAMSVGRPVVATGLGGSGEYLRDGENCLLFDLQAGAPGLAERVHTLAGDEVLRSRLRSGGFETARSSDDRDFSRAAERVLHDTVDAPRRRV
jgi:glycogen synthase